jgi:sulfite exporter TauE/SafE
MTDIVREHNLLTGHRFVIVEYAVVGLLLGLLGLYYVAVGRLLDSFVWLGMTLNCTVVAVLAISDLRAGAEDLGILPLRRREFRQAVAREHPNLGRRTSLLIVLTFLPCVLAAAVLAEGAISRLTVRAK